MAKTAEFRTVVPHSMARAEQEKLQMDYSLAKFRTRCARIEQDRTFCHVATRHQRRLWQMYEVRAAPCIRPMASVNVRTEFSKAQDGAARSAARNREASAATALEYCGRSANE